MSEVETPVVEPVEPIENPTPVDDSTAELQQEPAEPAEQPEAKPEKTFSQEELDKIVQKRLAKESRRVARMAEIEAENRFLKQQMEAAKPQPEQPQGKPSVEQFDSYEDYLDALSDWKVEQKLSGFQQQTQKQSEEAQRQRQVQEFESRKQAKIAEGAAKYPDFNDVVSENPDLTITPVMAEVMLESEMFADLAYHLGNNPDEAMRIARLHPAAQAREIIKLESKVNTPPKPTQAPPPIVPSGQKAQAKKDPADFTDREWAEWVRKARKGI